MSKVKAFWERCRTDRRFYFQNCLKIRTMVDGKYKLTPFLLNDEQEQILNAIEEQEQAHAPVRLIILKSRKVGCSTLIEALGQHYCQFSKHANAKCIAHLKDSTKEIFGIAKRYQQNLPDFFDEIAPARVIGHSIQWTHGSRFAIQTQGATDAARGSTPDFLHLSELALWWKNRRATSDEDVLQSQLGSLEDKFGTTCIIESTAHGAAGAFYNRFWQAWKNEPGNIFRALFFGWQEHVHYRLPAEHGDKALHERLIRAHKSDEKQLFYEMASQQGWDVFWADRMIEFNLEPCQVRWALQTLRTKFGGDLVRFDTEYPLSPQIAFTSSAKSPFDQVAVEEISRRLIDDPPACTQGELLQDNMQLVPGTDDWRIWHLPDPTHEYLVTIDSAHGVEDGDFSCIQVLDRTTREQVAEYYARQPPDITARQAALAGRAYNNALLVPEIDGPGLAVVRELLDMYRGDGYTNLYVRSTSGNWTQRFGFRTQSQGQREAAIAALGKAIRLRSWTFNSLRLMGECKTFIENMRGRAEAMPGAHDDAVMAMSIAIYLDSELGDASLSEPYVERKELPRDAVANFLNVTPDEDRDPHLGTVW